jgi:hypothetical protein
MLIMSGAMRLLNSIDNTSNQRVLRRPHEPAVLRICDAAHVAQPPAGRNRSLDVLRDGVRRQRSGDGGSVALIPPAGRRRPHAPESERAVRRVAPDERVGK